MFTVVLELIIGLFFLVVIFSLITSWVSDKPLSPKSKSIEELCPNIQTKGSKDNEET
jgi:hypothetical protein